MNDQPTLETPRLRIEPFREELLSARYVGWLNAADVVRYSEQRHRHHTLESCRAYLASYAGTDHYFWALVARDPALGHVGNINAYLDPRHQLADVGILVGERALWGRGYGREAWCAVVDFLIRDRGLRKVTGGTLSVNRGMLAILDASGMVDDGRRRRHHRMDDGELVDVVYAAAFRDAWLERHPQPLCSVRRPG